MKYKMEMVSCIVGRRSRVWAVIDEMLTKGWELTATTYNPAIRRLTFYLRHHR